MSASEHITSLSGEKKVALLLLAMGKSLAGQVLKHFTADELRAIPRYGTDLDRVSGADIEALVEEFGREFANGVKFLGTSQEVEDLIFGALTPEQIAEINSSGPVVEAREPPWERLAGLNEQIVVGYIAGEHPQITATILNRLNPDAAAKVLALIEGGKRREVMGRMLSVENVNDDALAILERVLEQDLLTAAPKASSSEGRTRLANIINKLEQDQANDTLSRLEEVRPEEAKALRSMLFNFSDIGRLTLSARTALLDKVPTDRLVMALRGTDEAFQTMALTSVSPRTKRMIEAELKGGQKPPAREVRAAQRGIADMALAMAARGEIVLTPPEGDLAAAS